MKKIILLLIIIFTLLFSNTSWGDWSYVLEDLEGISLKVLLKEYVEKMDWGVDWETLKKWELVLEIQIYLRHTFDRK